MTEVEIQVRITYKGIPADFYAIQEDHAVENTSCVLREIGKEFDKWLINKRDLLGLEA